LLQSVDVSAEAHEQDGVHLSLQGFDVALVLTVLLLVKQRHDAHLLGVHQVTQQVQVFVQHCFPVPNLLVIGILVAEDAECRSSVEKHAVFLLHVQIASVAFLKSVLLYFDWCDFLQPFLGEIFNE